MDNEIIKIVGKNPGPKSVILVGVHGNEKCGVFALEKLIPTLEIDNGEITFVYGNPKAIESNVRFTEANLNRMFRDEENISVKDKSSYEYNRAQFIKGFLNESDFLLDMHASFTPNSRPFIICEQNAINIVKFLPFDLVVHGFDEHEPGGTDYYMNKIGKVGICVECGYLGDSASVDIAESSIFAFIKAVGHIKIELHVQVQKKLNVYHLYHTKTERFVLSREFSDFEEIEPGVLIGIDGETEVFTEKKSSILFARNRYMKGDEAFLLLEVER